MGGNALKQFGVETKRLPAAEYHSLVLRVMNILQENNKHLNYRVQEITAYATKESFGDADILYTRAFKFTEQDLRNMFPDTTAVYNNGDVLSFDFEGFQVDLIYSQESCFDYALAYFSQNDIMGNLAGKIAHKFGLKHGHKGLLLPIRDGDHLVTEIVVTEDPRRAYEFMDLDPSVIVTGFQTLEEGYNWVSASRFFDPEAYKLENLNHIAKVRDRKRTTYNEFLEYCKTLEHKTPYKFYKDKTKYLTKIFEYFPAAEDEFNRVVRALAFDKLVASKFNGALVRELTGYENKELGMLMKYLKNHPDLTPELIVLKTTDQIKDTILELVNDYDKTKREEEKITT